MLVVGESQLELRFRPRFVRKNSWDRPPELRADFTEICFVSHIEKISDSLWIVHIDTRLIVVPAVRPADHAIDVKWDFFFTEYFRFFYPAI